MRSRSYKIKFLNLAEAMNAIQITVIKGMKIPIVFMLLLLGSCSALTPSTNQAQLSLLSVDHVASIRENMPEFENLAKEWHDDAYLVYASLPIGYKEHKSYLYSVVYASPSDRLTLSIMKRMDGTIITENNSGGKGLSDAINNNDLVLDSLAVFDLAYDYLNPKYAMDENGHFCGVMILRRSANLPGKPVVWRVYFDSCTSRAGDPLANIIIDPVSGAEIQRTLSPSISGSPEPFPTVP